MRRAYSLVRCLYVDVECSYGITSYGHPEQRIGQAPQLGHAKSRRKLPVVIKRTTPTARHRLGRLGSSGTRRGLVKISNTCIRSVGEASPKLRGALFQIDVDSFVEQAKIQRRPDVWRDQLEEVKCRQPGEHDAPRSICF